HRPVMSARDREVLWGCGAGRAGYGEDAEGCCVSQGGGRARHAVVASGSLRRGDGDGAAGAELLELPRGVGPALLGGLARGVEVGAQLVVELAALEHLVGDLQ